MDKIVLHRALLCRLTKVLGQYVDAPGDEVRFLSPFVSDHKHHLYVNLSRGVWNDYKSGRAGGIKSLLRQFGDTAEIAAVDAPLQPLDALRQRVEGGNVVTVCRAELPAYYTPILRGSDAYRYLVGRGVTEEMMVLYRIGEGRDDMANIVVLPTFGPDGVCDFWTARRIDDSYGPKYLNPTGAGRRYHLGYVHIARMYGDIAVLAEGSFSAMFCGLSGVATFGKQVSKEQIDLLCRLRFRGVIIALDSDVSISDICKLADRLLRRGIATAVARFPPGEDAADLGIEETQGVLRSAVPVTAHDLLRARLLAT